METIKDIEWAREHEDFSLGRVFLHWIWTFPAMFVVGVVTGELYGTGGRFGDNVPLYLLFYLLGFGGLLGFTVEFIYRIALAWKAGDMIMDADYGKAVTSEEITARYERFKEDRR